MFAGISLAPAACSRLFARYAFLLLAAKTQPPLNSPNPAVWVQTRLICPTGQPDRPQVRLLCVFHMAHYNQ